MEIKHFTIQHATLAIAMIGSPGFDFRGRSGVHALTNAEGEWELATLDFFPYPASRLIYRRYHGREVVEKQESKITLKNTLVSAAFGNDPYARHFARPVVMYTE